jgi:hypothetical protein
LKRLKRIYSTKKKLYVSSNGLFSSFFYLLGICLFNLFIQSRFVVCRGKWLENHHQANLSRERGKEREREKTKLWMVCECVLVCVSYNFSWHMYTYVPTQAGILRGHMQTKKSPKHRRNNNSALLLLLVKGRKETAVERFKCI